MSGGGRVGGGERGRLIIKVRNMDNLFLKTVSQYEYTIFPNVFFF